MNITGLIGLVFTLLFFGLMIIFSVAGRTRPGVNLREIPAFRKLRRVIGLAVEAGSRLHLSIGRGSITGTESASAFVGLSMLRRMARSASVSDTPPVATAGDASLAILTQDSLSASYQSVGYAENYDPSSGRLTGFTPFSYAAGAMSIIHDEQVSANILIGNFGSEVALITEAGERASSLTMAGTDNIPAQAILYATAQEPLIGEEMFAGGAYIQAGPMHAASLLAQDALRWILVAVILGGIVLKLLGLDSLINDLIAGLQ